MINIHYHALSDLLKDFNPKRRLGLEQREQLRAYRQKLLLNVSPDFILGKNEDGKPIDVGLSALSFNQTHSQQHYALAYSKDVVDLGIDIEDLSRDVKMQALAKRSFHPEEYEMWENLSYNREYWFKVWTIKEAVLKAHGAGITLDLKSVNSRAHPDWNFGVVHHAILGNFIYQNICLTKTMLTVAYRQQKMDLEKIHFYLS